MNRWVKVLRDAADRSLRSPAMTERLIRDSLKNVYRKTVVKHGVVRQSKGAVSRFTVDKLKPELRRDLERRIFASTKLIRLNRDESINTILRRFEGWVSSVPTGGSEVVDKRKTKENIVKPLRQMNFKERRVVIDQTNKFAAAIEDVLALDSDAIAAEWNSIHAAGYNFRRDHRERDGKVYAIRGCWAMEDGYMKAGNAGYTDDITKPGEEVYCGCSYTYLYSPAELPANMLTAKGKALVASAKR